jgi:hypothetical protein
MGFAAQSARKPGGLFCGCGYSALNSPSESDRAEQHRGPGLESENERAERHEQERKEEHERAERERKEEHERHEKERKEERADQETKRS